LEGAGASVAFAVCEFALEFLASVGAAKVRRAAAEPKKIACPNRMRFSFFENDVFFQENIVEIFGNAHLHVVACLMFCKRSVGQMRSAR